MNLFDIGPRPFLVEAALGASFVIVPSVILLGASRLRWLAARPWALLVAGPLAFVGCYEGLCFGVIGLAPQYFQ